MRGKSHQGLLGIYPTGRPDSYGTDGEVMSQFTNRLNDSVLNSLGAARRGQTLNTPNDLATFIYNTSGNLCAANVYTDAKQGRSAKATCALVRGLLRQDGNFDASTWTGSVNKFATADVHTDMGNARVEENQITRLQIGE